jgi:hypothetical protein
MLAIYRKVKAHINLTVTADKSYTFTFFRPIMRQETKE